MYSVNLNDVCSVLFDNYISPPPIHIAHIHSSMYVEYGINILAITPPASLLFIIPVLIFFTDFKLISPPQKSPV